MISTPASDSSDPITLEAVKFQFDQWRKTRSKRCKVPECLWNDVKQLSKQYSYSQISSQLRISYQQLHAHLTQDLPNTQVSSQPPFISAHIPSTQSLPHLPEWPLPSPSTIEIQGLDGLSFKAIGLNHQDLVALVHILFRK
jgi:hypothetical protein